MPELIPILALAVAAGSGVGLFLARPAESLAVLEAATVGTFELLAAVMRRVVQTMRA